MSDLNNKHLPSDIDSLNRKDLVELYHIQVAEHQRMLKELEQQQAQIEQLRKAIKEHNDECEALCQPEQCGYAKYARDCPNCPKQNLIDTKQLKNGGEL